jgi:hypothetical protein
VTYGYFNDVEKAGYLQKIRDWGAGVWDVISDVVGGTDAGHAAIHTPARVRQKTKTKKRKKYIKMNDFIMTVHITNSAGFRRLNSLSNIFTIIGFYFEAFTVIMVAHFKW